MNLPTIGYVRDFPEAEALALREDIRACLAVVCPLTDVSDADTLMDLFAAHRITLGRE